MAPRPASLPTSLRTIGSAAALVATTRSAEICALVVHKNGASDGGDLRDAQPLDDLGEARLQPEAVVGVPHERAGDRRELRGVRREREQRVAERARRLLRRAAVVDR